MSTSGRLMEEEPLQEGVEIGPYFFEDQQGSTTTVNGSNYRMMLQHLLAPKMEELDLENMCHQQDGALQLVKQWHPT